MVKAARRAVCGKRGKPGPASFMANLETEVLRLERQLTRQTWRPGGYVTMELFEPKHRVISAAPFRDRVVHHALCAVIDPIFERGFIDDSYANRTGKGIPRPEPASSRRYRACGGVSRAGHDERSLFWDRHGTGLGPSGRPVPLPMHPGPRWLERNRLTPSRRRVVF